MLDGRLDDPALRAHIDQAKIDLAAALRLADRHGFSEGI